MEVGYYVTVTLKCSDRARNRDVQDVLFHASPISAGMAL